MSTWVVQFRFYRPYSIFQPGFQHLRRLFPLRKRSPPPETVAAISQNGRCHLKRSMPFFSSELHSLGLRTQKVAVPGNCVSLVVWVRARVRVLLRVRPKNPSSNLEIFGLFFSSSFSFINVFFSFFVLIFVNIFSWFVSFNLLWSEVCSWPL